jgi:hypothetical protein
MASSRSVYLRRAVRRCAPRQSRGLRMIAVLTACALVTGCFGYNKSAKRWAYVGDTILVLGGGGTIAAERLTKGEPCMEGPTVRCDYAPPLSGVLVVGAVLVAAGLVGILLNATRDTVKTSR